MKRPNLLYLGQTPLNKLDSAPQVRTYFMHQAFKKVANVTFINGSRKSRVKPLLEHLKHFPTDYYHAAYLEAATSTSTPVDFLMLHHLKKAGIPLGIFIRDAYQMFDLSPRRNLKEELLYRSWFVSQWVYRQTADVLFYPSQTLADYFDFPCKSVLPPGARLEWLSKIGSAASEPTMVLYSGTLDPKNGGNMFFQAMENVVKKQPDKKLLFLSNSPCPSPWENAPWVIHLKGNLEDVLPYVPQLACGVIPRPLNDYNHLAMPLKTMDYTSLGIPMLVTNCYEMSQFVTQNQMGLVCDASVEDMTEKLMSLLNDHEQRLSFMQSVRHAAYTKHNWVNRVEQVLETLIG